MSLIDELEAERREARKEWYKVFRTLPEETQKIYVKFLSFEKGLLAEVYEELKDYHTRCS